MSRECVRCSANTTSGARCKRTTCKYAKFCFQHTKSKLGVVVKASGIPNSGQGLYAVKDIPNKSKIVSYGGKIVSAAHYNRHPSGYGIDIGKGRILDGKSTQSGLGRYANACTVADKRHKRCKGNNARLSINNAGTASVKSTKSIKKGQEIFVSYGKQYWKT